MRPQDIGRIVTVAAPTLSPDGATVAYLVTRVDLEGNAYRSAIWLAAADRSTPPRQLTSGEHGDGQPAWSPDGTRIAFTRHGVGGDAAKDRGHSLHVLYVDGRGEVVTLAKRNEAIESPVWSPDGSLIAFTSRVRGPRYDVEDERAQEPRRIDRLFSRLNGEGWTIDRPAHAFVVPAAGSAAPRQLTEGPEVEGPLAWSPDGSRLVFVSGRHPHADLELKSDLWSIGLDLASDDVPEPVQLTRTEGGYAHPTFDREGRRLAYHMEQIDVGYHHPRLHVLDLESGVSSLVAPDLERNMLPHGDGHAAVWDGDHLLTGVEDRGNVHILRIGPGGEVEQRIGGTRSVTGWSYVVGVLAFTATGADEPSELFVLRDGTEHKLTSHQQGFLAACPPLTPERFEVTRPDGTELDGWLLRPPGFDPERRYPALVTIHGGPHTQYGERWFDEVQLWASGGFVVLWTNPRGSSGGDEPFARAILSPKSKLDPGTGWGGVDYEDIMAFVDACLERAPYIDPKRLGVLGGSYGGFMTSWIIGHNDRFGAACSERSANNLLSLEWSSDAGGYFQQELGVDPVEDPDEFLRMSPTSYIKSMSTPLLILHSENDLRCHIEQADSLWVPLHRRGHDVEYYRFPAESHELSRSGAPKHRVRRAELIVDWFTRKLKSNGEA
ncbi:MAG TPA: S9 family peptidase [Candidatus Dormibacteraeota bacterium]|jgi:dipeptidyl aminopeptidase/acylaminoacyl peptidase|nr:S9 family peptidase [Candidatus Dormibacteraeota bacterium]